ncbi:MAG: metallophosphoesterase [Planctomycetes bacterium]|nr:metallophosphoesterase [Planctomycetota bacterium]
MYLFAITALLVLFGMHRYFWARAVRALALSPRWRRGLGVLVALLGGSIVASFALVRSFPADAGGRLALPVWIWFGFLFYALLALGAWQVAEWIAWGRPRRDPPPTAVDAQRRLFLRRAATGAGLVGAGGVAWKGERSAAGELLRPEVPVRLERLPRALSGLRIAQLTDMHVGPLLGEDYVRRVVSQTLRTKPDLIVITGDLVDGSVEGLRRSIEPLFGLRARFGVYFVTGNHEYYSGAKEWTEYLAARGIRVLTNERVSIGDTGASFDLIGIPDLNSRGLGAPHALDIGRAFDGRDEQRESILLAHQPRQILLTRGRDLGLQLSGHTHGGQMWPFGALVLLAQPYLEGLHTHSGRTQIYVSRGVGTWGPPVRVGNPAEIPDIILT